MILRFGKKQFVVKSLKEAQAKFVQLRGNRGYHTCPVGFIDAAGTDYFVSYNGRVWKGTLQNCVPVTLE